MPNIRKAILGKKDEIHAYVLFENEEPKDITLKLGGLTDNEREILLAGCLITSIEITLVVSVRLFKGL